MAIMRKKILSILALFCLTVTGAWADSSGSCGDGLTWSLSKGILTIMYSGSGTGLMTNYSLPTDVPWYYNRKDITHITIETGVTRIGQNAFFQCSNASLTTISIPASVWYIGANAFQECSNLTSISIPNSERTIIGESAFTMCSKLETVYIGKGVSDIGNGAFNSCPKLKSITVHDENTDFVSEDGVLYKMYNNTKRELIMYPPKKSGTTYTIPSTVTTICEEAFSYCSGMTSIDIPSGLKTIKDGAFSGCSSLTSIDIPSGVTTIGTDAFSGCSGLTSITIPSGVTRLEWGVFMDCSGLTSIELPARLEYIGTYAFYKCSGLTSISIPAKVTKILETAFQRCTNLGTITVESGNTTYDSRDGCNAIIEKQTNKLVAGCKNSTIPATVTSIGQYAFEHCSGLTSVVIPASVTSIGYEVFYDCEDLESVTIYAPSLTTYGSGAFAGNKTGRKIYVFSGCVDTYKAGWSSYSSDIEAIANVTVSGVTARQDPENVTNYWTTYYHPAANVRVNTGVQMFKASLSSNKLTLTEIDGSIIKAGEPVVLKAPSSRELIMELTPTTTDSDFSGNELKGTTAPMTGAADNMYVLNAKSGTGAGFYKLSLTGTLGANKAYLTYTAPAGAPTRGFFGFDETTGIDMPTAKSNDADAMVYDLQGRRVDHATKGLYIVNGKKVITK